MPFPPREPASRRKRRGPLSGGFSTGQPSGLRTRPGWKSAAGREENPHFNRRPWLGAGFAKALPGRVASAFRFLCPTLGFLE
jgi:hypothetical protein